MAPPASVTTRHVVGTYIDASGTPLVGTISFRVDQPLIATLESWGVLPSPTIVELDATGSFDVTLMTSTDIDLFPSGFRYLVQERFNGGYVRSYSIDLPAGASPLALPMASQFEPGDTGLAIVHSINGRVGIVQLAALDFGAIPITQKGTASGVATLDSNGKLLSSQMPAPTAGVASVDGRSGVVTLTDLYSGVGHVHTYPVTSVNGLTGAVTVSPASIGAIPTTQKGAVNGVAALDGNAHLMLSHIPEEAWVNVFDAASQAAMLALPADRSDICRRTDTNTNFMLVGNDPSVLADWKPFLTPPDAVPSVNGMSGNVVLTSTHVGALATGARGAANGVASLDAGVKVPTAQIPDLDASKITTGLVNFLRLPTGSTASTVAVGNHDHNAVYIEDVEKAAPFGVATLDSSGRLPSAQLPASLNVVSSVNGQIGLVVLTANDVGAVPTSARGAINGVASLDGAGVVPPAQIPNIPASRITSGVLDIARIPTGTTSAQVAVGDHTHAYIATTEKGAALGVASLDSSSLVPIGQLPTGSGATQVALGSHDHETAYISLAQKGAANGVATLDGAGLIPLAQIPDIVPVDSVNGMTGAVVLNSTHVGAIPTTARGALNGVASLDSNTLVPFAQLPTGTGSAQVAIGNHTHSSVKAILNTRVTSGNTNPLPNTSSTWVELDIKYRMSIAADVGDLLVVSLDMAYDLQNVAQKMDFAVIVAGTPIRYASSGTSTPATNGDPALGGVAGGARTTGFTRIFIVQSGDTSGGLFTGTLMTYGPGTNGTVYSSTASPLIVNILNHGASGV